MGVFSSDVRTEVNIALATHGVPQRSGAVTTSVDTSLVATATSRYVLWGDPAYGEISRYVLWSEPAYINVGYQHQVARVRVQAKALGFKSAFAPLVSAAVYWDNIPAYFFDDPITFPGALKIEVGTHVSGRVVRPAVVGFISWFVQAHASASHLFTDYFGISSNFLVGASVGNEPHQRLSKVFTASSASERMLTFGTPHQLSSWMLPKPTTGISAVFIDSTGIEHQLSASILSKSSIGTSAIIIQDIGTYEDEHERLDRLIESSVSAERIKS